MDYRGEVGVILYKVLMPLYKNSRAVEEVPSGGFFLDVGTRIAQAVICAVPKISYVESELDETERGEGGFGSTK